VFALFFVSSLALAFAYAYTPVRDPLDALWGIVVVVPLIILILAFAASVTTFIFTRIGKERGSGGMKWGRKRQKRKRKEN